MLNGSVITVENQEYMVLETANYKGKTYLFTNIVKDEEPTEVYEILELISDEVIEINDENLLKELLDVFNPLLKTKYEESLNL